MIPPADCGSVALAIATRYLEGFGRGEPATLGDPSDPDADAISIWTHWRTNAGAVLAIAEMSERHLGASLRLVLRTHGVTHPGLAQEWRRRGLPEAGWQEVSPCAS